MKFIYIILIFCSLIVSILVFITLDNNLGNDYYYLTSDEKLDMGGVGGPIVYKSTTKNVYNNIIINDDVLDAKSNCKYIIAVQKSRIDLSINYYIIHKSDDKIYGPLSKNSYESLKKQFEISLDLRNIDENNMSPAQP